MATENRDDLACMRQALNLARRAEGRTSPNPMVGAVITKDGRVIGEGWHHQAGKPHAEVEAIRDALRKGQDTQGSTLHVTLEPCCTHGRTPPCTEAIIAARIGRVVVAARDPNPRHRGRGFRQLRTAGIAVVTGVLAEEATRLNEVFNHWITRGTPFITVKAAMTLDGKLAARDGESKWITGPSARAQGMRLRRKADAILVGINTVLADNPSLTLRPAMRGKTWWRVILDSRGRIPLASNVVSTAAGTRTLVAVNKISAEKRRKLESLGVVVLVDKAGNGPVDLGWLMGELAARQISHLLVEGGGETQAAFFAEGLVQRVCLFYAPLVLADAQALRVVAGDGLESGGIPKLREVEWKKVGKDLMLTARVEGGAKPKRTPS